MSDHVVGKRVPTSPLEAAVSKFTKIDPLHSATADKGLDSLLDDLVHGLDTRGCVVVDGVYSVDQIAEFKARHDVLFAEVLQQVATREPDMGTYLNRFAGEITMGSNVPFYHLDDRTPAIKLAEGRWDFCYGMSDGCFGEPAFHEPPVLKRLMRRMLKREYSHYAGALPSTVSSGAGPWHRDTYDLFDGDAVDVTLPPYYFTVLIPLVPLTPENGATEIIVGSHRVPAEECKRDTVMSNRFQAVCNPGSIVIFDGRCCHRGLPNTSSEARTVLYMVWHKNWYNDYGGVEFDFPLGSWRHEPKAIVGWEGWCVKLAVKDLGAKGKGIVATDAIQQGTVVFDSNIPSEFAHTEEELRAKLGALVDLEDKRTLLSHVYCHDGQLWEIRNNGKYTNHGRPPTIGDADALKAAGGTVPPDAPEDALFALVNLAPGDEITEDYGTYESLPFYEELCEAYGVESTSKVAKLYS